MLGKDEWGKISVFVHAQGMKTVQAGGWWVRKWQNLVHVVVECALTLLITKSAFFLIFSVTADSFKQSLFVNIILETKYLLI